MCVCGGGGGGVNVFYWRQTIGLDSVIVKTHKNCLACKKVS